MPDFRAILDTIRHQPDDERHWLALASWLWDNGRDNEAAVVRVFWSTLGEDVANERALEEELEQVRRHRRFLGPPRRP